MENFVGPWLVSIRIGGQPSVLRREEVNPLFADGLLALSSDGTLVASGSPSYPIPEGATSGDRLLVGTGIGSWSATGDRSATARFAALVRRDDGNTIATLFVNATADHDEDNDTLSGSYTVEVHQSRAWTRNLPSLDGALQAWRVEPPS